MSRVKMSLWIGVVAISAFSAVGCCQDQEKQIAKLQQENKDLQVQRDGALKQLQSSEQETSRLIGAKDAEIANRESELAGLRARMNDANYNRATTGGATGWEHGMYGDRVVVGSDLLFKPGDATLTAGGKTQIDKIVQDIKTHYTGLMVRVYGFTDADPIVKSSKLWDDNLELSSERAMAVTRYMIGKGVKAGLIETIGMGAEHPAARGSTAADKAKDRRVEIYVVKAK